MSMNTFIHKEYDTDFYAWTLHNATLLREGRLSEIDVDHLAEEIESMGQREKRELLNRLAVLISHLLKWKHQPSRRSKSWEFTIKEQRLELTDLLEESPSLARILEAKLAAAYKKALLLTEKETGLESHHFPSTCAFSFAQLLDQVFLP